MSQSGADDDLDSSDQSTGRCRVCGGPCRRNACTRWPREPFAPSSIMTRSRTASTAIGDAQETSSKRPRSSSDGLSPFRRGRHRSTQRGRTEQVFSLSSLPDDILRSIFDVLPETSVLPAVPQTVSRTAGGRYWDALSLSQTCRRLNSYYRNEYVTRLELIPLCDDWEYHIARVLSRYPSVTKVAIDPRYRKKQFDIRQALSAGADIEGSTPRAANITSFEVPPLSRTEDIVALYEFCPSLNEISVAYSDEVSDGMRELVCKLPNGLKKLRLSGLKPTVVSDSDGCRLGELLELRSLRLDRCLSFGPQTSAALSGLRELEHLSISRCTGLDEKMAEMLQELRSLAKLSLVRQALTPNVLKSLPVTLRELDLSSSEFIQHSLPDALFSNLKQLRFLKVGFYLETWEPLREISTSLQTLVLPLCSQLTDFGAERTLSRLSNLKHLIVVDDNDEGGSLISDSSMAAIGQLPNLVSLSLEASQLTDCGVAAALKEMNKKRLRKLNLSGCERVGDESCEAIADIELESVDLSFTSVTIEGVRLLTEGVCHHFVQTLDLSSCPRIVDRELAEEIITTSFLRPSFKFLFDFDEEQFFEDARDEVEENEEENEDLPVDDQVFVLDEDDSQADDDDEEYMEQEYDGFANT